MATFCLALLPPDKGSPYQQGRLLPLSHTVNYESLQKQASSHSPHGYGGCMGLRWNSGELPKEVSHLRPSQAVVLLGMPLVLVLCCCSCRHKNLCNQSIYGARSYHTHRSSKCCCFSSNKGCVTLALPSTLRSILRQKKNYENSNISPCKNIILKRSSKKNQNPSR
jgi:hypothetical protein